MANTLEAMAMVNLYGTDLFGDPIQPPSRGELADKFLCPPFTTLNAREGWWQDRKRAWIAKGIKSEEGRDIEPTSISRTSGDYMQGRGNNEGGSIFDPVLCEILYLWFATKDGLIVDPFAGGSVRGIVAAETGYRYWGSELRGEQVNANAMQAAEIIGGLPEDYTSRVPSPIAWQIGDSRQTLLNAPIADFIFSCPPYGNLEIYSDDPADLSNMPYGDFMQNYRQIIKQCFEVLKPNRFACFVVGEYRDKKLGSYVGFVPDTIKAFTDAGFAFYNEAILLTSVGSLPIRTSAQFPKGRKLGKAHQNILVFVKGCSKKAASLCKEIEFE
jgi:hypothetical protein